ncbi:hypothetical protein CW732_17240 [Olleya sp. Bg11-27]|nr:hypothetical protein CW732_17240 [Olleya sp. Bg11-27]
MEQKKALITCLKLSFFQLTSFNFEYKSLKSNHIRYTLRKIMNKNIAIIILSFVSTILSAQTKPNLADLSPLESTKIVLLGEQTQYESCLISNFDKFRKIKKLGLCLIRKRTAYFQRYFLYTKHQ